MTLRLFRRVRIAPGLRVNLSKSGASVSIGCRGGNHELAATPARAAARTNVVLESTEIAR